MRRYGSLERETGPPNAWRLRTLPLVEKTLREVRANFGAKDAGEKKGNEELSQATRTLSQVANQNVVFKFFPDADIKRAAACLCARIFLLRVCAAGSALVGNLW